MLTVRIGFHVDQKIRLFLGSQVIPVATSRLSHVDVIMSGVFSVLSSQGAHGLCLHEIVFISGAV